VNDNEVRQEERRRCKVSLRAKCDSICISTKTKNCLLASLDVPVNPLDAAAWAERDRIAKRLRKHFGPTSVQADAVCAVVYAPPDPEPSEVMSKFLLGGEAMRAKALENIACLLLGAKTDPREKEAEQRAEAYRGAKNSIGRIVITEPL
jgi:hypothetical protein